MKTMRLLVLFGIIALGNCSKGKKPIGRVFISGTVVDGNTGKPVPDVFMVLREGNAARFSNGNGIADSKTDVDGKYKLTFDLFSKQTYTLGPDGVSGQFPEYFHYTGRRSFRTFDSRTIPKVELNDTIWKTSWAVINVKNTQKLPKRDEIFIEVHGSDGPNITSHFDTGLFLISPQGIGLRGKDASYTRLWNILPNTKCFVDISTRDTAGNWQLDFTRSLNCTPGDTSRFSIQYAF